MKKSAAYGGRREISPSSCHDVDSSCAETPAYGSQETESKICSVVGQSDVIVNSGVSLKRSHVRAVQDYYFMIKILLKNIFLIFNLKSSELRKNN